MPKILTNMSSGNSLSFWCITVGLKFSVQERFMVRVYDDRIANANHVLSHAEIMKMANGELPNMQLTNLRRAMPTNRGKKVNGHVIFFVHCNLVFITALTFTSPCMETIPLM